MHKNAVDYFIVVYGGEKMSEVGENSFHKVSDAWLAFLTPQLKRQSINKYKNNLNLYLLPEFGFREISEINRTEVGHLISQLLSSGGQKSGGLSPKTVADIYSVMKNVFYFAAREQNLHVANIDGIPIKRAQPSMRILSRAEQDKLSLYLCINPVPNHLGVLLSLYAGLRIGEVCALKWKNISFDEQCLYVTHTMQRVQNLGSTDKKTEIVVTTPKSKCSIRRIPLPSELLQILINHREAPEAYLLTSKTDHFMEPRTLENRFRADLTACGITDANYHALRHTFATRCVELGFDVKSLSEILGHSSVGITMNRYVHPSMELKQRNMNLLSDFLVAT